MNINILNEYTAFEEMSVKDLLHVWPRYFDTPPKNRSNKKYLVSELIYRLQELIYGGLTKKTIDRLSRSLADFAKMVEIFDKHNTSFVSVTQHFNTKDSMGRLTLNILLSFAQFEREVIGERIRDKLAASKRKGMWMGGAPPLGYDVVERKLLTNAT